MNLAFTTLLVLIALFPGFFFQSAYHSGPFSKKYARSSVYNNVAGAILPSLIYHAIYFKLINGTACLPSISPDAFKNIGILMFGKAEEGFAQTFGQSIGAHIDSIVYYIVFSVIIGAIIGFTLAFLVRRYSLDSRFRLLRYDNTWYYLVNGEMLGWPSKKSTNKDRLEYLKAVRKGEVDIRMEILVEVNNKVYIYQGIAHRYFLNRDGLDRIHLDDCSRIPFPETDEALKALHKETDQADAVYLGDDFVIFRDTMININISYQKISLFDSMAEAQEDIDLQEEPEVVA